jgi:anti-sigma factor RsiW
MSFPDDATETFAGRMGCPSELVLDRLHLGELSPRSKEEVEVHLEGCDICRQRMTERTAKIATTPSFDANAALSRIQARLAQPAPEGPATPSAATPSSRTRRTDNSLAERARGEWRWLLLVPLFALLGALIVRWLRG